MNEKQKALFAEFKKMSDEELGNYETATIIVSRIVDFLGIASVLVILFNLNILMIVLGIPIILVIANYAASLHLTLTEIRRLLEGPAKDK